MNKYKYDKALKYYDRYDKYYRRAYRDYQDTGMTRFECEYRLFEDIRDICQWCMQGLESDHDDRQSRREHNYEHFIDKIINEKYTREEVIKLIKETLYL